MAVRRPTALLAAALLLAGCGSYDELKRTVETLAPDDAETVGNCQEYGGYVVDTQGYGCAYFVPGTRRSVSRAIAARLRDEGFDVSCREDRRLGTVDLSARAEKTFVYVHVSKPGSVITLTTDEQPLNIYPDTRFLTEPYERAPRGHVIVKLLANAESRALPPGTRECGEYVGIL